ncbi:ROK family protein [Leifsonia sp. A12D58]|uniref:ROK family transcriptional regulator n=1 Tax=Leifsonia sp. A12D58 TaxID=3397674 RepID=UPI0039E06644
MASPDVGSKDDRLEFVRLENLERCFRSLREDGASTVADLAVATGLSRPTITDRLQDLVVLGLASEVERVVRRGQSSGRPASRFALNPRAGFVIGVELGKHQVRILVADMTSRVRMRYVFASDHRQSVGERMQSLVALVADIRARHDDLGPLWGIGAAVPGSLSPDGLMTRSPIFAEWAGQNVADVFAAAFDVPVTLQNDLNAAALAEHRHGAAIDASDVVLVLVWHQITAGIVIDGVVHAGKRSLAGEISQLKSSAHAELLERWPSMPEFLATVAAAESGDAHAHAEIEEFAHIAGEQIATMLVAIDPDVVVLYGPAAASELVAGLVTDAVYAAVMPPAETPVVRAQLGEDAAVTGVLIAALESVGRRFFGVAAEPIYRLAEANA